ncbi:hypothetical protein LOK74_16910 [Brevibacillus humidisoli]|uniref:hypothetical protein n=1 Tax=Brevibacillus humidisoli TaxID=2895522 RepID=UPI001E2E8E1D|nr:hypothetical protein [Brevibacillus humidisoli]UFJ39723.1 hypothetical protein LOK74_16910 [Brevibacillus humidisoli]
MKKKMLMHLFSIASVLTLVSPTVGLAAEAAPQQSNVKLSTDDIRIYASKYIKDYDVIYPKWKYPTEDDIPREFFYEKDGFVGWLDCSSDDIFSEDRYNWRVEYSGWVYSYGD